MLYKNNPTLLTKETILRSIMKIITAQNRCLASENYGCFDRAYWSWRQRDFPNATLQYAILPLAYVYSNCFTGNDFFHNKVIRKSIIAGIKFLRKIQRKAGTFDQMFPNEYGYGPTAYVTLALAETYLLLQKELSPEEDDLIKSILTRAGAFLLKHNETYGNVANHLALFLATLTRLEKIFGNVYQAKVDSCFTALKKLYSNNEGWFKEYEGADPAYQTQTLFYLTDYFQMTKSSEARQLVLDSLSLFLQYCYQGDNFLGGTFSSRDCEYAYPYSWMYWSNENGIARALTYHYIQFISDPNHVYPFEVADFDNFIRHFTCCLKSSMLHFNADKPDHELPFFHSNIMHHFKEAGILIKGTSAYYAVIGLKKGGVTRVINKRTLKSACIGGYFASVRKGERITNQLSQEVEVSSSENRLEIVSGYIRIPKETLTPFSWVFFRAFNLTFQRLFCVSEWFKSLLAYTLISKKVTFKAINKRTIIFSSDMIDIEDKVDSSKQTIQFVPLEDGWIIPWATVDIVYTISKLEETDITRLGLFHYQWKA